MEESRGGIVRASDPLSLDLWAAAPLVLGVSLWTSSSPEAFRLARSGKEELEGQPGLGY